MPRYFFDISLGQNQTPDEDGLEYPDLKSAVLSARISLADLVREATSNNVFYCGIVIRDTKGSAKKRISAKLREDEFELTQYAPDAERRAVMVNPLTMRMEQFIRFN